MRINRVLSLFHGSLLLTAGLLGSRPAAGQAFWDPANRHASPGSGGSGNWDNTTSDWWVSGTVDGKWSAGNSATFAGNPGTVTVNASVAASGLAFATNGYQLAGSSQVLSLIGNPPPITLAVRGTNTIGCILAGTNGLFLSGAGTLSLNGNNAYTGPTTIGAGTTLALGGGGQLATTHSFDNLTNNGTFLYGSSASQTLSGILAGPGQLVQSAGTLTLGGTNTYTGATLITKGTLVLGTNSSINSSPFVQIGAGGVFNVTSQPVYVLGTNTMLTAAGVGNGATAAAIRAGNFFNAGTQPITLIFSPATFTGDSTHQALVMASGRLQLNGNLITVSNATATPLGFGTYTLLTQAASSISNTSPLSVAVVGAGVTGGNVPGLQISGGTLSLLVRPAAAFSNLNPAPTSTYGSTVALTGQIQGAGPVYPTNGEPISATVAGHKVTGSVTNTTGNFVILYTPANTPVSATPYPITYAYAGDSVLSQALDQTTTLTIQPAALTITATNQTTYYGSPISLAGSTAFSATGLQNAETIGFVTMAVGGPLAGSGNALPGSYAITPSAATGGTFAPANYTIAYVPGTLTVLPPQRPPQILQTFTWQNFGASYAFGGLLLAKNTLYGAAYLGGPNGSGSLFSVNPDGTGFNVIHSFTGGSDAAGPIGPLIISGDTLYGVTYAGGQHGNGSVFSVGRDGSGFRTLHLFGEGTAPLGGASDGQAPEGGLILSGSTLYGTTRSGGNANQGTVFSLQSDGTQYRTLYSFTGGTDGAAPLDGLLMTGSTLIGTASGGGLAGNGTVFKINTDGSGFTTLYGFQSAVGAYPNGGLLLVSNVLYGTANQGGAAGLGAVFALNLDGSNARALYSFTGQSDGSRPEAGLLRINGTLYGTANSGGSAGVGTVFAVDAGTGNFQSLHSFSSTLEGANPAGALVLSGNQLLGTTTQGGEFGGGSLFSLNLASANFVNLRNLSTGLTIQSGSNYLVGNVAGAYPVGGLTLGAGTLYGSAAAGGNWNAGTIFRVATNGASFGALHTFTGGADGGAPAGMLVLAGNTLYGTTSTNGSAGYGTVFSLNTDGSGFALLHTFTNTPDGANPVAGLTLVGNTLYGTTTNGGSGGVGTIFALGTDGQGFTNLYSFRTTNDGALPIGGLTFAGGNLFGATAAGGAAGNGTVFQINLDGTGFTNLHNFNSATDGSHPYANLTLSGTTLYGTATAGGSGGAGTVFRLNTDGTGFSTLYNFTGDGDGGQPRAGLVFAGGTLYGTARNGGDWGFGDVFGVGTNGQGFAALYAFEGGADGANPTAGLIADGGVLYGAAFYSGIQVNFGATNQFGVVFALSRLLPALITWTNPSDVVYGTPLDGAQLGASANVPGNFLYAPPAGTLLPAGDNQPLTVTFTPADTVNFGPVTQSVPINVEPLPVALAGGKTRDGNATISFANLGVANRVPGDQVQLVAGTATLAGADVGTNAITGLGSLVLGGSAAGNYTLLGATGSVVITNDYRPFGFTSATLDTTSGNVLCCWQSTPGRTYHLLMSTNLAMAGAWVEADAPVSPVVATGTSTCATIPVARTANSRLFLLIRQQ